MFQEPGLAWRLHRRKPPVVGQGNQSRKKRRWCFDMDMARPRVERGSLLYMVNRKPRAAAYCMLAGLVFQPKAPDLREHRKICLYIPDVKVGLHRETPPADNLESTQRKTHLDHGSRLIQHSMKRKKSPRSLFGGTRKHCRERGKLQPKAAAKIRDRIVAPSEYIV